MNSLGAPIVSIDEFVTLKPKLGTIVMATGGFDPIHPGHVSNFLEAKKLGDTLVVVVNGDWFLQNKKGKPFQDLETRCLIISGIRGVDYVVPFEIENDVSVCVALEKIKPNILAKGGDRKNPASLPPCEAPTCKKYNIEIAWNVGIEKQRWSSSWFLKEWEEHKNSNKSK